MIIHRFTHTDGTGGIIRLVFIEIRTHMVVDSSSVQRLPYQHLFFWFIAYAPLTEKTYMFIKIGQRGRTEGLALGHWLQARTPLCGSGQAQPPQDSACVRQGKTACDN